MTPNSQSQHQLRNACRMLYRYKARALAVLALGVLLTVGAIIVWPRSYASEAKLFVRLGRESVSLDPTATTGQTIAVNDSRETEINSVLEILGSRSVFEKVVDQLGPEAVLNPPPSDAGEAAQTSRVRAAIGSLWSATMTGLRSIGLADDIDARERAITNLADSVNIYSPRRSSVAVVRLEAKTPEHAQLLVDAIIQAYREEHLKANRTSGSLEFFQEQSKLMAADMQRAYERLRDEKNSRQVAAVPERRKLLEDQVSGLDIQLRDVQGQLAAARAEIRSLEVTLATVPERLVADQVQGLPNQAADAMRDRLFELQVREQELLARHTEDHPLVRAVRAQVRNAQAIYLEENQGRQQETSNINPIYQPLELRRLQEGAHAESLQARQERLLEQRAELQRAIADFNNHEMTLAELQREVDLLETNYVNYAKNLELARIDHALALERISNVNVVQPATLVTKPVSPKKPVFLGLGLLLSIACSLGVVLLSDFFDGSLHSNEDVEDALDLPALVTVPKLTRSQFAAARQPVRT